MNLLVTRRVSEDLLDASLTRRVTILPQIQPARIDSQPIRESCVDTYFRGAKGDFKKSTILSTQLEPIWVLNCMLRNFVQNFLNRRDWIPIPSFRRKLMIQDHPRQVVGPRCRVAGDRMIAEAFATPLR